MNRTQVLHMMLILAVIPLSQVSGSFFDRTVLKTEGKIVDGTVEDLNDDGLLDILVVYTTGHHPHIQRWLAVFYQRGVRIFDPGPDQLWEVDPQSAVLDIGDVSSDPGQEIVVLRKDGVFLYARRDGAFATESRRLIETETIFAVAEEEDLPTWDFARDICPDEGDEVLVPGFGKIELWSRGEGDTYQLQQTIPVKTTARVYAETAGENYSYSLRADYRVPKIDSKDFNNNDRTDLIVCWEDNVDIFLQKPDGTFPSIPDHELRMKLRTEEEIEKDEVDLLVSINDLNGDGQMDVVANKMKGGLANAKTQTSFYLGQTGGTFPEIPDQMMTADDAVSEPYIIDLDGDNRCDLIQPEVKMGIKSVVSMLLMKKFDINFLVYLNREDGLFPEEPDFSTKVSFKIDFTQQGGSASPLIEFEGDYNNDGRKDLAVGTKEDELSVFFGDTHKVFTKKPQVQETVKTSSYVVAKDFDGDGKTELLLYYPDQKEIHNQIIILWPK